MQIRERTTTGYRTIHLEPRTVARDIRCTTIHGVTGQEIQDAWIEAGETVYVRPGTLLPESRAPFWEPGDPPATAEVYDGNGMLQRILFDDRDALAAIR